MKRTLFYLPVVLLLYVSACFADAPPVVNDYAYGMKVEVGGDGAMYEIVLPLEIYRGVSRADLGDICIFNNLGEIVPHALLRPAVASTPRAAAGALPIFPIPALPDRTTKGLSLQIRRDSTGAIIDVDTGDPPSPQGKIAAYLLDASALPRALNALELDWQAPSDGFVGRITVETSDDLDHWTVVAKDAPIASLRYGERSLEQRKIGLRAVRARYFRLSWAAVSADVQLSGVTAQLVGETEEPARQWTAIAAGVKPERAGEYYFDTSGRMPVDRVRVILPQKNTLVAAALLSRASAEDAWRFRQAALIYSLQTGEEQMANPDIALAPDTDRYWMLRIEQSGGGLGQGMPRLELGWVPQRLLFVARGDGPFLLAYGNAQEQRGNPQTTALLQDFAQQQRVKAAIKPARTGPQLVLGGEARLQSRMPAYPWKQWALWCVLMLGVMVLAWMAVRLYRRMNSQSAD